MPASPYFPRVMGTAQVKEAPDCPLMTLESFNAWVADEVPCGDVNIRVPGLTEFSLAVRCAHDDQEQMAIATDALLGHLLSAVSSLVEIAEGHPIVWRIRSEINVWDGADVLEYGPRVPPEEQDRSRWPDRDPCTDLPCVFGPKFTMVKVYARFGIFTPAVADYLSKVEAHA